MMMRRSGGLDMFRMFKTGMDLMGDANSALYAEPTSMAQVYDLMHVGACNIGLLPPRSRKTKKEISKVYKSERMELLQKILSYKDCCKVDCSIVMPTCLRMHWCWCFRCQSVWEGITTHAFRAYLSNKYPEEWIRLHVKPRGDIRVSIVPPDFQRLPMNWLLRHSRLSPERIRHPGPLQM